MKISLSSASSRVELLADAGGAICRYCTQSGGQTFEWLRPGSASDPAAFVMVPFCSRIKDARFRFAGRHVQLRPNLAGEPHAIHGQGWQNAWAVMEHGPASVTLQYRHRSDDWPWDYVARQEITLDEDRLGITLSVRNDSDAPMPAGLGLHPFFTRTPGARLQADVVEVWKMDDAVMPLARVPLSSELNLPSGIPAAVALDNVFAGWNGRCRIEWPEWQASLGLEASAAFGHLVVYTPAAADFFCVEPASHVTDAFNMMWRGEAGHGGVVLGPGESLEGSVGFSPAIG